ncbi:MAG TPA: pitrilysin family protein [Thermoanaerobaculia bacterium]|nr:pitrilysin family protein [Thermoanaerobaculia bacterium]
MRPAALDRSVPPPPGEIRPFHFPAFERQTLPSGLQVLAARLPGVPLVSLELLTPAGAQYDPAGAAGLATLTGGLLDEGTAGHDAMEIAARVEGLGGHLATGADWDVGYLATGLLSRHLAAGIDLLAEVATSPTFPGQELERLRRERLAEILRRGQDPSLLADERLAEVIYRGTVYAHSPLGSPASIGALRRDTIVDFYRRHYPLRGATLIAVGDLDPEALLGEVVSAFDRAAGPAGAEGASARPPSPPEIRPTPLPGIAVHVVDRPGAAQTELRLGHAGVPHHHPDYMALSVLNSLLGGKFTSRINLNLRERHGYTYGASSRFSGRLGPGPFAVSAAVETGSAGAAAREVLAELRRIREELVEPEEMEDTRSYVLGIIPCTFQTIADLTRRLQNLAIYGLPDDYFDRYMKRVASLTRQELLELAQRRLDPEHIAVVAVGPAETLLRQLDGLGEVTLHPPRAETLAEVPAGSAAERG